MAKLSRDLATPPGATALLHPRETLIVTGNIAAVNAEIILPCDGCTSFALDIRGAFSLTLEVSGTIDGTNWTPIPVRPVNQAAIVYVAAVTGTAAGVWVGKPSPYRSIRVRCTAFTSGSCTTTLVASTAALDDTLQGMVTSLIVTTQSALSTGITLTLPAPGAGLRQYLTYIAINRINGTATALTAAAGPILVTTTNLPGALVFSRGNGAIPAGEESPTREDFAYPLAASAQNTALTIVAPVSTGAIWRLTAGYYVAP